MNNVQIFEVAGMPVVKNFTNEKGIKLRDGTRVCIADSSDPRDMKFNIELLFDNDGQSFNLKLIEMIKISDIPEFAVSSGFISRFGLEEAVRSAAVQAAAKFGTVNVDMSSDLHDLVISFVVGNYGESAHATFEDLKPFLEVEPIG